MKPYILLLALIFGFQWTMTAQKSKLNPTAPKEDIRVNREYDENGNLIKFDSLYSYSWSGDSLLVDSIHPGNFRIPFGNDFHFFSDSSFFGPKFFQDRDQDWFDLLSRKQDSIMNQFRLHQQFYFKNDSIESNFMEMDEFFKQFSENKKDSISPLSPFTKPFNFSPNSMSDMMKMLEQQIKEMEEQLRDFSYFVRVHHSWLVNMNEVSKYIRGEGGYLVLSDGSSVNVSRSRKETLLKWF